MKIYIITEKSLNDNYIVSKFVGTNLEETLKLTSFDSEKYPLDQIKTETETCYSEDITVVYAGNIIIETIDTEYVKEIPTYDVSFKY